MTLLRRLFSQRTINPDEYERVRCDACHGTGQREAMFHMSPLPGVVSVDREPKCLQCDGTGWLLVKKPDG